MSRGKICSFKNLQMFGIIIYVVKGSVLISHVKVWDLDRILIVLYIIEEPVGIFSLVGAYNIESELIFICISCL